MTEQTDKREEAAAKNMQLVERLRDELRQQRDSRVSLVAQLESAQAEIERLRARVKKLRAEVKEWRDCYSGTDG